MAEENKNERVNNKNDSLINLNIEYVELTEDNIKDINKYTNFDDYTFLSNFIRLMREFKNKDKYLYYVFNAIEELDIISLYGQNEERINFITKNDDNYRLIFEIIDNPLIKLKIIKILYTIHDNKNNDYKSKNIRTYIQYLQSNWKLYLPYFNSDKHIYIEVFTSPNVYILLKNSGNVHILGILATIILLAYLVFVETISTWFIFEKSIPAGAIKSFIPLAFLLSTPFGTSTTFSFSSTFLFFI